MENLGIQAVSLVYFFAKECASVHMCLSCMKIRRATFIYLEKKQKKFEAQMVCIVSFLVDIRLEFRSQIVIPELDNGPVAIGSEHSSVTTC